MYIYFNFDTKWLFELIDCVIVGLFFNEKQFNPHFPPILFCCYALDVTEIQALKLDLSNI